MDRRSSRRWAVGTLSVVAIGLAADSIRRTHADFDSLHAPQIAIRGQLDAFNRSDYQAAYRFAAPEIQAQFPLPAFQRMVEQGYPQIAHSRTATFGRPEANGDTVVVPVKVAGQDGVVAPFLYLMRHEPNGWRVAGVQGGPLPAGPRASPKPAPARKPPGTTDMTAADYSIGPRHGGSKCTRAPFTPNVG